MIHKTMLIFIIYKKHYIQSEISGLRHKIETSKMGQKISSEINLTASRQTK